MLLKKLRNQLCQNNKEHCRECFVGTEFKSQQNPPNVFRTNIDVSRPIAFIFDKPNDNTNFRNSELVPITIFDDRAGVDRRLPRAASHSNLISLCKLLGLIAQNSNCLEDSSFYITNAVKCDMCSKTGKVGRVNVNNRQATACRERFLAKELMAIEARALVFFGKNAQRFALGKTTPLWSIHKEQLNGSSYWVMRVPHTSPTPFNTHGGRGQNYIAPFNELCQLYQETPQSIQPVRAEPVEGLTVSTGSARTEQDFVTMQGMAMPSSPRARAIVFAYHNVGVRCLSVLLAHGVDVPLVVTHTDNPSENIWFDSVAKLAALHDIPVITPDDPNTPEVVAQIQALKPDFIFSFYYRNMLKKALLDIPSSGAYNMHGSLLPQYRGRVPVNWAIIKGERETGSTLHVMNEKPDNGAIVDQQAVPILPDDTALEVFQKVTCAAEVALNRCLPALLAGTAQLRPQDLSQGGYFGGRRPEDGKIDWLQSAQAIHNLVRAVAPPYPGAYTLLAGKPVRVLKTLLEPQRKKRAQAPAFYCENNRCYAECGDGKVLRILALEFDGKIMAADEWIAIHGTETLPLGI